MNLILDGVFFLEKFPGKGGWTFVKFPVTLWPSGRAFGMVKVSGSVDNFQIEGKHLMPMGNGFLFLPVSKEVRKAIGKESGDQVFVKLTVAGGSIPEGIPEELIACLEDDPGKLGLFQGLSSTEQKHWVEYIYSANSEELKASRIIKLLSELKSDS